MVVPISNSKNYVICPFCGNPELLSERSEEQANKEIRICKHCGQEINTRKKKRENDGDTSLLENFYFQMSFLTYREIYHILKNSKISEKNVKSLDLTEFEISKIVDQVRRETINGSFLVDLKEKFPRGQFPQIRRLYQEIREEQKQEQLFQDELRIHFEEATMDMFSIFCGDQSYYELTDIQKRIITNIIQEDGFNPEDKDINNSFNQQVWLHAASYIHHILIERENVSYSNSKLILSPIRINEIAQEFTDFFTGDQILEKWNWKAIKLKNSRLEKELKSLQSNLKRDWIFRESFVAQAKRLIIFITHLIRGEIDINLVKDLEKKIVEKLSNDLNIDNNSHISSIFKFNFMLVITRFVYFILRTYPNGPPLGENLMDSEDSIEQKITWYIKREMLKSDSVKESFLRSLHEMKINDFNEVFSKIKRDIKKDFMFSISFNMYLESIITQVIKLISTTKKKSQHSLDERAIIENLANYNFQWNVEKNPIFNYSKNKDSFGNTHKEAQMGVMKVKESIYDKLEELKDDDSYAEGLTTKVIKSDIFMGKGIIKKGQKSAMPNSSVFNINIPNFREVILKYIEEIVNSIECSDKQKKIILSQSEIILDNHISRAKKGEITIPRNTGVIANASAIIYAVIVSNECMPKITGKKLSELAGVSRSLIPTLYRKWYKDLAQRYKFDFQRAPIKKGLKMLSFYFFEFLLDEDKNKIKTFNYISNLKKVFLSQEKGKILDLLTEKEIKWFKNLAENYPDMFLKFFSDLFNVIRLLIKSLKMHKIIKADFSIPKFARFLVDNEGIDLLASERTLISIIGDIFEYLKNTKYSYLFPSRTYSQENVQTFPNSNIQISKDRRRIVGSRIKLYLMRNIYNGRYYDTSSKMSLCLKCVKENKLFNLSVPIIRAKEFHHQRKELKEFSYTAEELFKLYNKNRGNPYFLQFLVEKAKVEKVELLCRCHHSRLKKSWFSIFQKLICWENIPSEFPQDIFTLPTEIIHLLIWVSVDSYYDARCIKNNQTKIETRLQIIQFLKKKYIIDIIYNGNCPICKEFNTRDHLLALSFNHRYMLKELPLAERELERKKRKKNIFKLSCSQIVKELERQQGAFICANCHMFFHSDIDIVDKIFDDQNISKLVKKGVEKVQNKFNNNLIYSTEVIRDVFRLDFQMKRSFIDYFSSFTEILEESNIINTKNITNKLGLSSSTVLAFFSKRKDILEKYGSFIKGKRDNPTEYHLNNYGITILRLIQYFKNNYCKTL